MTKDRVLILDTTLRDGEQAPGASMNVETKLTIAALLDEMCVDIIEAGFPAASPGDAMAVRRIAGSVRSSIVAGLSRATRNDIEVCASAVSAAKRPRIHTFISTSPLHMHHKLRMSAEQVYEAVIESVRLARNYCDDVEWSCEDGTRSDREFLKRCFEAAISEGASTVNIADTVGFTTPDEFQELVLDLRESVPGMERVRFSVHCHDDLGMAVANSLAAIKSGARQIECTVNGVGERAGNASLEEIVMAIKVRGDRFGVETGVRSECLAAASAAVSEATGFIVPPNKAVVGANAFAHESGIHQHGVIVNRNTYEIIDPTDVGAEGSRLVLGKHSGKHALRLMTERLQIGMEQPEFDQLFVRFKRLADTCKQIDDDDLRRLAGEVRADARRRVGSA